MHYSTNNSLSMPLGYGSFGTTLEGRNWSAGSEYRYGFNGKEKTSEIYGENNTVDFGARLYNSRLGIWMSIDPASSKFPHESPYIYCSSSPIAYLDGNGEEKTIIHVYIDKKTGDKVILEAVTSNDLIMESFNVKPNNPHSQDELNYAYYDYSVTYTHYIEDGVEVSVTKGEKVKGEKRGETIYPTKKLMKGLIGRPEWGGVNWTSSTGQGQETKKGTIDVKQEDIDVLLSALSVAEADKPATTLVGNFKIIEYFIYGLEASGVVDNLDDIITPTETKPTEPTFKCNYPGCGDTITEKQKADHGGTFEEIKDED